VVLIVHHRKTRKGFDRKVNHIWSGAVVAVHLYKVMTQQ
jgi:hypothetical protein